MRTERVNGSLRPRTPSMGPSSCGLYVPFMFSTCTALNPKPQTRAFKGPYNIPLPRLRAHATNYGSPGDSQAALRVGLAQQGRQLQGRCWVIIMVCGIDVHAGHMRITYTCICMKPQKAILLTGQARDLWGKQMSMLTMEGQTRPLPPCCQDIVRRSNGSPVQLVGLLVVNEYCG